MVQDTAAVYSDDYFKGGTKGFGYTDYDQDKEPMIPAFNKYITLLEQCQPPGRRMLDCGAATGFFLDIARQRGWQTAGVEISPSATETARGKGLDMFCGTIEDYPSPPQSFDAVTMWDVIEHIPDAEAALRRIAQLIKPNGILALNTPDAGSLLARTMGVRWHLVVPPEHLVLFDRRSLRILLDRAGFDIVIETCIGKKFTVPYIFRTLGLWQKLPIWKTLAETTKNSMLRNVSIPLNLHDNVCIFTRRRA
jgi:SAM-dependent methyltransferase